MRVGFYLTGGDKQAFALAAHLVRSVRSTMPGVAVTQFTDETSAGVSTVDHVQRLPTAPLSLHRTQHYAQAGYSNWLFVDTDVVIQRSVAEVFAHEFDVAVVDRQWTKDPCGHYRAGGQPEFIARYPYNAGVVFSRCPAFWIDMQARIAVHPKFRASWMGDQAMLCQLAQSGAYRIKVLPGMIYNFPPDGPSDLEIPQAAIVHYKGTKRKQFLVASLRKLTHASR